MEQMQNKDKMGPREAMVKTEGTVAREAQEATLAHRANQELADREAGEDVKARNSPLRSMPSVAVIVQSGTVIATHLAPRNPEISNKFLVLRKSATKGKRETPANQESQPTMVQQDQWERLGKQEKMAQQGNLELPKMRMFILEHESLTNKYFELYTEIYAFV